MKLVHPELKQSFSFIEEEVNVWIIEKPSLFYQYIMQLAAQIGGEEGRFVLSENLKELKLQKKMDILLEPWSMDFSNRRIQTQLYEEMKTVAWQSENYIRTQEMLSGLNRYVLDIEKELPYEVCCNEEIEFSQLMKALNVRLEADADTLLEKLILYIKICSRLLHMQILTLVNIKCYLNQEELSELYKASFYEKIFLFLIESEERGGAPCEKRYVLDKDMCEIVVDS